MLPEGFPGEGTASRNADCKKYRSGKDKKVKEKEKEDIRGLS